MKLKYFTKKEMTKDIITVLNFAMGNPEHKDKVRNALKLNWYLSEKLMTRVLLRQKTEKLLQIHHDVMEAIY
jgi:F0F1-type ATP synthase beta subunit